MAAVISDRSALLGTDLRTGDLGELQALSWGRVESTLNHLAADAFARDRAIEEMEEMRTAPTVYARAFLLAAKGDVEAGREALREVDASVVPGRCAYAAWRLGIEANAGLANRFWLAVGRAAEAGELGLLQAARVRAVDGKWEDALKGYLTSDPARWTSFDVSLMASGRRVAWRRGHDGVGGP
ncbi:MAG: hypothetical protein J6386_11610 [Candidatus Synoicihabitans palmerolidicus]|nr:hypothetical protein [Candidatus Synoicihabitans palmerolidicus]